jgi:hypothetical protein
MNAAIIIAIVSGSFVSIFFALFVSATQWRAEEDKARARRLVDAKMNARLLRLNL